MEKELGSKRVFVINDDGSISFFTDNVTDQMRAQAEAERDRLIAQRESAGQPVGREVGSPVGITETAHQLGDDGDDGNGKGLKDLVKRLNK